MNLEEFDEAKKFAEEYVKLHQTPPRNFKKRIFELMQKFNLKDKGKNKLIKSFSLPSNQSIFRNLTVLTLKNFEIKSSISNIMKLGMKNLLSSKKN